MTSASDVSESAIVTGTLTPWSLKHYVWANSWTFGQTLGPRRTDGPATGG